MMTPLRSTLYATALALVLSGCTTIMRQPPPIGAGSKAYCRVRYESLKPPHP